MHTYKAELEKTRKAEEDERASRGVRLCKGAGQAKCPDETELPITSPEVVCDACSTRAKERAKLNREKRLAATAERNKAKDGKKECVICHKDYPLADFEAERRLKGGDTVSNKCKSCREKAKEVQVKCLGGERAKEKRLQEQAQRGELCDAAKKEGRRICSRQGSVTRGCWVVLPDDYEPATCEPCIKLREEYNAYKQAKLEAGKRDGGGDGGEFVLLTLPWFFCPISLPCFFCPVSLPRHFCPISLSCHYCPVNW